MPIHIQNPKRFLVIRLGALGDVVDVIPSVHSLKSQTGAAVDWVVKEGLTDLVAPWCDHVIEFPKELKKLPHFFSELRQESYSCVLDYHANLRSALIGLCTRASERWGFAAPVSREGAHHFYSRAFVPPENVRSRLDRSLWLTRQLGFEAVFESLAFPEEKEDARFAEEVLSEGHHILVVPTASKKGNYKKWPEERWKRLFYELKDEKLLVLWGPGEEALVKKMIRGAEEQIKMSPPTTLNQMMSLIRRAQLVVGADTGPLHMAHLLSVPTVVLFGPKDPLAYGPQYNRHEVIYHKQECSPCRNIRCDHVSCMWSIGASEVARAIKKIKESL